MKFTYQGRVYEYRQDKLPLADAVIVQTHTGMGTRSFLDGLNDGHPMALKSMVFLAMQHNGEKPKWDDIDFDVMEFLASWEKEGEPVPTPATGTTQWPEDEATSPGLSVLDSSLP